MSILKTHRFTVDAHWLSGQETRVSSAGKPELRVATPPEFRGGIAGVWSPEDLLVAAAASCYAVTLAAVAERRGVPLRALDVHGAGDVTARPDGRFRFTVIELDVGIETDPGCEAEVRSAALAAERVCLVAFSLDTPVHVALEVKTASAAT